jgi:hypothetical protein
MKLIWHIVLKDVARHRWPLVAWLMMLIAPFALGLAAQNENGAEIDRVIRFQQANVLLLIVQFSMGYFLISSFVQGDELTGTQMFWLTRPISGARLLAAKLIGIGLLFAILPVVCLLPWWLRCGLGLREIGWTAVETLGWQLLLIAPAFLLASLTADLGRVIMWSLLLIAGLFAGVIILQAKLRISLGDSYRSSLAGVLFTRLWLAAAVLVVGAALVTTHQYLTRRWARSVALAGANWAIVILVGAIGWLDWSGAFDRTRLAAPPSIPSASLDELAITVMSADEGRKLSPLPNQPESYSEVRVVLGIHGIPNDVRLLTEDIQQNWRWADSLSLQRPAHTNYAYSGERDYYMLRKTLQLPEPRPDPETIQWQALAAQRWAERHPREKAPSRPAATIKFPAGSVPLGISSALPASIVSRMESQPPSYEVALRGVILVPQLIAQFPVKAGCGGAGDNRTYRVLEQIETKLQVVTTIPSVCRTGLWQGAMGRQAGQKAYATRDRFYLVDHSTNEIGWVSLEYSGSPRFVQIGGVVVAWEALAVSPGRVVRQGKWVFGDPQWADHSTLALLTDREAGSFTRDAKVERFEIKRSQPEPEDDAAPKSAF